MIKYFISCKRIVRLTRALTKSCSTANTLKKISLSYSSLTEAQPSKEEGLSLETLSLSKETLQALSRKNINSLFSIQKETYPHIVEGKDLVGRARTGTGKTLAFALPTIEKILKSKDKSKNPKALVLAPTRELANQVFQEFQMLSAKRLNVCCVYGGVPYGPQEFAFKSGVSVVVGTPGRIKDHLRKGTLNLKDLQTLILDEADYMLDIGFAADLDQILDILKSHKVDKSESSSSSSVDLNEGKNRVQFLLFSATLPSWIKDTIKKYLRSDHIVIDLIGEQRIKSSSLITHNAVATLPFQRSSTTASIVDYHVSKNRESRIIIFNQTKIGSSELASDLSKLLKIDVKALHGDVSQASREQILRKFKSGQCCCIVATDVAARGIDVPNVDAVIHSTVPDCHETFIHRSGRTGRAGRPGTSYLIFDPRNEINTLYSYERQVGIKFERIACPASQQNDTVKITSSIFSGDKIDNYTYKKFSDYVINNQKQFEKLLGLDPQSLLATCMTVVHKEINKSTQSVTHRSLLTAKDDTLTLYAPKKENFDSYINLAQTHEFTKDFEGVVFDVDLNQGFKILDENENIQKIDKLPELKTKIIYSIGNNKYSNHSSRRTHNSNTFKNTRPKNIFKDITSKPRSPGGWKNDRNSKAGSNRRQR